MAKLIYTGEKEREDYPKPGQEFDVCTEKDYFRIGRHEENDLVIEIVELSRFHAMIFRYRGSLHVIDYSYNGTRYNQDIPNFNEKSVLGNIAKTNSFERWKTQIGIGRSEAAFKTEDIQNFNPLQMPKGTPEGRKLEKLNRINRFEPHRFAEPEDIEVVMTMLSDEEGLASLASQAKKINGRGYIQFSNNKRLIFRIEE